MPSSNNPQDSGTYSGNNGARIFRVTHDDIDSSDIDVSCQAGSVEVVLDERIWWSWGRRNSWRLGAGDALNTTVDVDSSWYDGDHRLTIFARAAGTRCTASFSSSDF